jgi:hypothetical protein
MVTIRQVAPAITLLAILPVVGYLLGRSATIVALSALSVVIIAWSLYAMFGPSDVADGTPAP